MAGIYLHIPFCKKRCIYCDFYSDTDLSLKNNYVAALLRETKLQNQYFDNEVINTIYFGGGTPSLLSCSDFEKIFDTLNVNFKLAANPEITLESNPDDLTAKYVEAIKKLPFNRLSIGIQSFDNEDLRFLNRRHTARKAINAVRRCQDTGFSNISIDLIYGLPRQTIAKWEQNIESALNLDIQHISAYSLSYEEGTKIYDMKENGMIQPIEDERNEFFFKMLIAKLTTAGFIHYEISNFARQTIGYPDGILSKHNSSYWNGAHYLGLGASAHSYNGATRQWNVASLAKYMKAIQNDEIPCETEFLDRRMKYNDFIITRLRTMWGVPLDELENLFGTVKKQQFLHQCEKFLRFQMLVQQSDTIQLTPQGIFISDSILRDLIEV